ncbi:hypothetical protein BgiBS90_010861 [Biomphalaria glabrata]|nr:hypothetical protein BgiBS90_010861 [Biomphalaria glabrata]
MNPVKMILPFILGMLIASSNELAAVFEVNFGSQSAVYVLEESVIVQFHTCLCTSNSQECKYTKDGTSVESRQMLNTSLLQYSNSFFCYFKLQSELSCERLKNYFLTKECSSLKETPCTVTALSAYGSSCPENMALSQPPVPKEDLIPGNKQRNRLEEIKSNFNGDSARHNASTNQTHSEHEYLELIDYNYPVEEDQRRTQASAQHVDNIDETAISKDNIPEKDTAQNASFSDTIQNNKDQNNSIDVDKINETFVKVFAESDTSLQKTTTA